MKEFEIKSVKNKETAALDINIKGHLNVANIANIQKELKKHINKSNKLLIHLSDVDDADITIIQLLISILKQSHESNVEIKLTFDLSTENSELFTRAGFANIIN